MDVRRASAKVGRRRSRPPSPPVTSAGVRTLLGWSSSAYAPAQTRLHARMHARRTDRRAPIVAV